MTYTVADGLRELNKKLSLLIDLQIKMVEMEETRLKNHIIFETRLETITQILGNYEPTRHSNTNSTYEQ